jgi:hypothetical protein
MVNNPKVLDWLGNSFSRRRLSIYNCLEENSEMTPHSGSFDFALLADLSLILPPTIITNVADGTLKSPIESISIQ